MAVATVAELHIVLRLDRRAVSALGALWHGGPAGLTRKILPASVTGARSTRDLAADLAVDHAHVRDDRVFLTPDLASAVMFASAHHEPMLYAVWADGPLEPDPDCAFAGVAFQCVSATILFTRRPHRHDVGRARAIMAEL